MSEWWQGFQAVLQALKGMPELVALVCLFVLNNALWMIALWRISEQMARAAWEGVRQLTLLNREVEGLEELVVLQMELMEQRQSAPFRTDVDNL